jgi:hypothetical protein
MQSPLLSYMQALKTIESSGNYRAVGPQTRDGDQAYGAYQVMGKNVPAWTAAALGRSMSPQEFLNDEKAQDEVAQHRFGGYMDQYGTPQDAASMWFSGKPFAQGANLSDGYNNGSQYVSKFMKALNNGATPGDTSPMGMAFAGDDGTTTDMSARQSTSAPSDKSGLLDRMLNGNSGQWGDALAGAGAGLISINNPAAAAGLQSVVNQRQLANRPSWGVIGKDSITGVEKYGWIDPTNQRVTTASGSGSGDGTPDLQTTLQRVQSATANGTSREEALGMLPAEYRNSVKALIEGREIPQNYARGGALKNAMDLMAAAVDPTYDATKVQGRVAFVKNMAGTGPTSYGGQVNSANTLVEHMDNAYTRAKALFDNNSMLAPSDTLSALNGAKTALLSQSGDKTVKENLTAYNTTIKALSSEMERLLSGSHGAEGSKQYWLKQLDINNGPTAIYNALSEVQRLMNGRLDPIAEQKSQLYGVKTSGGDLLNERAKAKYERVQKGVDAYNDSNTGRPTAAPGLPKGVTSIEVLQ